MGNSPMTIGLKVDTPASGSITAGSILYGRIYLSVKQEGKVAAHSIRLKVIGKESVVVHHTTTEDEENDRNGGRRTSTRDHYERSTHDIWNVDHPIKEFPTGTIPRGQYEFPFALQLPKSLPSTMSSKRGQSTCEVRYEVVAEVFQKPNSIFYTNPNAKKELDVVALSSVTPDHDTSLQLPVEIVPINKCFCCSCTRQGTMALETKFDQTTLLLLESSAPSSSPSPFSRNKLTFRSEDNNNTHQNIAALGIQFRCQNKSTAKVKSVRAQLVETIEWAVNGRNETVQTILATSTKDAALYPELDAMWRKPFRWEQHRYEGNNDNDNGALLLHHKPWRTINPPLVVPAARAKDTYKGRAVQVRHSLTLSLITKGCCSTNPDVSSLVEIYRSPLTTTTSPAAAAVGTASHDPLSCEQHTPSAPFEDEIANPTATAAATTTAPSVTMSQATAPSDLYDNEYAGYNDDAHAVLPSYKNNSPAAASASVVVPMVEAQLVLPEDWNAQTAEIVTIPIAQATVMSTVTADGFAENAGYSK